MNRARHIALQILAAAILLAVVLGLAGVLVVQSGWFRERVRARIVSELESATGSQVELANFNFDWTHLTATVSPLILHGRETATEAPLARVESVTLGLRMTSPLQRHVDLASLRVDRPSIRIVVYADGSTNLPAPKIAAGGKDWAQNLVDLAVGHYEITRGTLQVDSRVLPLNVLGDELHLVMDYVPGQTAGARRPAHYQGQLSSQRVQLQWGGAAPLGVALGADFTLDEQRAQFSRLHLAAGHSRADLTGAFTNLRSPSGKFSVKAMVAAPDLTAWIALPSEHRVDGTTAFDGNLQLVFVDKNGKFDFALNGRSSTKEFSYKSGQTNISGSELTASMQITQREISIDDISGEAMGGEFAGKANFSQRSANGPRGFHAEGNFQGIDIREAAKQLAATTVPWTGSAGGVLTTDATLGSADAKLRISSIISPNAATPSASGIQGQIDFRYDQSAGTVSFGDSRVNTPATSINLSGTLGQLLNVRARTTDLEDLRPAMAMLSKTVPKTLPIQLHGEASANGTVVGPLNDLQFRGQAVVSNSVVQGHAVDRFSGEVQANARGIEIANLNLSRGATLITGKFAVAASDGDFATGELNANLDVSNIQLSETLKEFAGVTDSVTGVVSGNARISGRVDRPEAEMTLSAVKVMVRGQAVDKVRARVHYTQQLIEVRESEADIGAGKVDLSGTFSHPENAWTEGDVRGHINAQSLTARAISAWQAALPEADAKLDGGFDFDLHLADMRMQPQSVAWRALSGSGAASAITFRGAPLGTVNWTAHTAQNVLSLETNAKLRDAEVKGQGQWRLAEKGMPGGGTLHFSRINVATVHDLMVLANAPGPGPQAPPFDGYVEGGATVTMALASPAHFQAEVTLDGLEFHPKSTQALKLDVPAQDIQLRNSGPIVVAVSEKEARFRTAHFTARETNLEATGVLPFTQNAGADFNIKGNVNLAILQLLNPDLLARGAASVTANVRGSLANPAVNGRMELMNASLYLTDVPNGVDNANGVLVFDRNRATIERLTAETGGGQLAIKGSLEFGQALVYRLQGEAKQVRVRYLEDVSLTASAQLALNGPSDNSVLSGTLTLNRAAVTQGADLGHVLANASAPSAGDPNGNEYLRGMRLDVHVESGSTFQLETSLTRDIQTEVDLRLRGTLLAPSVTGTVSASSGEVQMFGNRYTVNRGDVRFLNPVKIEPVLDLDLETKARGIVVSVTVTGSPQKLNVNYSSDPPLQSREIISLLAVGRDPTALSQNSQLAATTTTGFGDAGGLLGQAVSEQLSNRLQRFFGSSRVKIDPTVTGVDTLPSARLTLEQQVSRDVTLTYTTNLNRTQEQIVRLQWDLNPQWSAVAVRDANGLFGIDFQYRKRFK